jgi:nitrogen fixation NifU-like protein
MRRKSDDWMDLYRKEKQPEAELHQGPLLFYNELVIDHFTNPRNVGEMENADGFSLIGDPSCGDHMKLWIKVGSGVITDIKFVSNGCSGAIAASSMMTVLAKGKTIDEAKKLTDDDTIAALGGIPEGKRLCSLMGVQALLDAIKDYQRNLSRSIGNNPK